MPRGLLGLAVVVVLAGGTVGCTAAGASRAQVESAVTTTFGHRLAATEPGTDPGAASGSCASGTGRNRGAGDWSCSLTWSGADGLVHGAEYEVQVTADGCFRAARQATAPSAAAPAAGPVPAFEGCTTWG